MEAINRTCYQPHVHGVSVCNKRFQVDVCGGTQSRVCNVIGRCAAQTVANMGAVIRNEGEMAGLNRSSDVRRTVNGDGKKWD